MIRDFRTFDWLSSVSSSEIMAKKNLGKDRARCPMTSAKNAKTKSGSFCNVTHKNPKSKTFKNFLQCKLEDVWLVLMDWTGLLLNRLASCGVTNWRKKRPQRGLNVGFRSRGRDTVSFRCSDLP